MKPEIKMLVWFLCAVGLFICSCVAIVNGEEVTVKQWPTQVAVNEWPSDPFQPQPKPKDLQAVPGRNDYSACVAESIRTGKHLALWQGYSCVSSEKQLPNLIHCHVEEGRFPEFPAQAIVIAIPRNGQLFQSAVILPDDVCAQSVKAACAGTYSRDRAAGAAGPARGG